MIPELYTNGLHLNGSDRYLFFQKLTVGCIPLVGFTDSKIIWWYNLTYFEHILATYSLVIDSQSQPNIKPLETLNIDDVSNASISDLIDDMMLEIILMNNTHFDEFYYKCAPLSCSYTKNQRRNIIVVLILLISICAGINKGLQILVPCVGKLIFFCIDQRTNWNVHVRQLAHIVYQSIKTLNLFETTTTDQTNIRQQQIYTRVYLCLFILLLSVLLFYTAFIERAFTEVLVLPSIEDYEKLVDDYSYGISCPCTHVSISYDAFLIDLKVNAFHDACKPNAVQNILTKGNYNLLKCLTLLSSDL